MYSESCQTIKSTDSQMNRGDIFVWVLLCHIFKCYCSWKQNFYSKLALKRHHKTASPSFTASPRHLPTSSLCDFRGECQRALCLIQCYQTLLYESIKLMVPDQPTEKAHKTETNWEIIVLINWSKSSITHSVPNLFHLSLHKLLHPKKKPDGSNVQTVMQKSTKSTS